jgi:hypothetical protein
VLALVSQSVSAKLPEFERIVIDSNFPGAYQVEVADINGDMKPDIVALGGGTVAWYENPSWKKRIITGPDRTPAVISSAATDLDGDGKAEVAIAYDFEMNNPSRGKLGLAVQAPGAPSGWSFEYIADVPSIHRLRWGSIDFGEGFGGSEKGERLDLVVAPIFGLNSKPPSFNEETASIVVYLNPRKSRDTWRDPLLMGHARVVHAIDVRSGSYLFHGVILAACDEGVRYYQLETRETYSKVLIPGAINAAPTRGSSEVHTGWMADGRPFLATIDAWHGSVVSVWLGNRQDPTDLRLQKYVRTVIDETLDAGHALWVSDVNGDDTDEIFAGHRGKDYRVSVYQYDGKGWNRTVLDREIAAQDLRGGDLDGNGVSDVVAVGGSTRNVVWYRPRVSK